jgi:hypothetical protein
LSRVQNRAVGAKLSFTMELFWWSLQSGANHIKLYYDGLAPGRAFRKKDRAVRYAG